MYLTRLEQSAKGRRKGPLGLFVSGKERKEAAESVLPY